MEEPRWFVRIYGPKPGRGAPKLERLLWFRGYYLRSFPLSVLAVVVLVVLLGGSLWWSLLLLIPLLGYARLEWEIRKARRP
jgi:hypothetical protein